MNTHKPHDPVLLERSLKACVKEGVAAQVMIGIFDYYLVPLALLFRATNAQIGWLVSMPALISSFSQIFAIRAVEMAGSRKKVLTRGVFLQALLLIPIPVLLYLPISNRFEWLLALVIVFRVLGSILGPAWGSLVSDYLPQHHRGKYFGRRAQIVGAAGVLALAFWGIFLHQVNAWSATAGLFFVFAAAAVCRFISYHYMRQLAEFQHEAAAPRLPFLTLIMEIRKTNFARFVTYVAGLTFCTQLSAAYLNVYMLSDLKFDYVTYTAVNLASVLTGLISFRAWGKHADLIGNAQVLKLTGSMLPVSPLLWALNPHPATLIAAEMFSGFIWAGFNLCATNYIYDAVPAPRRVMSLCYFNLLVGIALCSGAVLGGYLSMVVPRIGGQSPLVTLFIVSAACRILASAVLSRRFVEVRSSYHKVNRPRLLFSVLGVRPLIGRDIEPSVR